MLNYLDKLLPLDIIHDPGTGLEAAVAGLLCQSQIYQIEGSPLYCIIVHGLPYSIPACVLFVTNLT